MLIVTCRSCGAVFRTMASRQVIAACVCTRCRGPLANAEVVDDGG